MTTWYREGLVTLTAGSDLVAGVGTEWVDNVLPGGIFFTPGGLVEVERVVSDTSLKLVTPYGGATVAEAEYSIAPTQGYVVALAKQLNGVLGDFGELKDAWQDGTLVGKGVALKGVKNTVGELPLSGNAPGDAWMVDGHMHVWTGSAWLDQGATVSTPELEALRDAAGTSAGLAIGSALAADTTRKEYEDRVYPGVYATPPTNKPHSGAPCADGDRCMVLVGTVPYEHLRVGGGWLIPNIDATNLALPTGPALLGYVQSGAGSVVRNALAKLRENISAKDFGAVGDGVTNDAVALQKAFDYAHLVGATVDLSGGRYYSASALTVYTAIDGRGALIESGNAVALQLGADGVSMTAVAIACRNISATSPNVAPYAIYGPNRNGVKLDSCLLINGRVRVETPLNASANSRFSMTNCGLSIDLSAYEAVVNENDGVTIGGVSDVVLANNQIALVGVHRGIKIKGTTAGYNPGAGDSSRVAINGNVIRGVGGGGHKQLIDLFSGTRNIAIGGNSIESTGFGRVIENKTSRGTAGITLSAVINGNTILTDTQVPFVFEGFYGNANPTYNVGECVVKITGNMVISSASETSGSTLSAVKYYHSAHLADNTFHFTGGTANRLYIGQCKQVSVVDNNLKRAQIGFGDQTGSQQGDSFAGARFGRITATGNNLEDFDSGYFAGGVSLRDIDAPTATIVISGNNINQSTASAAASGAVSARSVTCKSLQIEGNASNMVSASEDRAYLVSTAGKVIEKDNSWNVLPYTGVWAPGAIAANASVFTDVTITGVATNVHTIPKVTHSALPPGVVLGAVVTAANTVRVTAYNVTGASVTFNSGTLRVMAEFISTLF
ncbi:glycosyl hydrolase family 28-related protein [Variovorax sp. UMC13]|uniref:glycosyl hydrolase family 28-related protein n=1 Tax=Variovorax sp. UMC13 TaxID=1862326 RepID=UPI0015FEBAE2|nr:glycosyl hydrolase family 28-related protein [Variovorax sp. UMC13]MBB1601283.1 hypothetical protein [Variovorax sp. UMC13]